MNKFLINVVSLLTFCVAIIVSSCENEIIEPKKNNDIFQGKTNFVTLEQVPFLIPSIEKFNINYKYLLNPSLKKRQGINHLNLDLDRIIEYVANNDCNSYSIPIKTELLPDEDYYFENLNIIKINNEFKPFITRYKVNDSEKFDFITFTGNIEIYDLNKELTTTIPFENGVLKIPPVFTPRVFDEETTGAGGNTSGDGPGTFITWILNQLGYSVLWSTNNMLWTIVSNSSSNNHNNDNDNNNNNNNSVNTFNIGGINFGNISIQPTGSSYGQYNNTTPYNSLTIIPNVPIWTEENTDADQINLIINRLQPTGAIKQWLRNSINQTIRQEVYDYMFQNQNLASDRFIENVIIRIAGSNGTIKSIKPFIIEKKIIDTDPDPCAKNVLTQIKNTTVCDIAQVLAKLDTDAMVYNTTIITDTLPNGNTSPATTKWNSPFNYTIYISPNYTGKTKLFRATIILHEMVHAYFMSLFDDFHNGNPQNLNAYNDFTYLFDLYVNKKYPSTMAPSIHHQQMATDYADAIARALQEYQTGITIPDNFTKSNLSRLSIWKSDGFSCCI